MHDTRALIARFVRDYPGSKPAAIADALQLKADTVRQTCKRMADKGQPRRAYHPVEQPGDTADSPHQSPLSLGHPTSPDQQERL